MSGNANSGRRTAEEEIEAMKEKLKKQTLEELATSKVFNHLKLVEDKDRQGVKEIALPVYLKSKADKKEFGGNLKIIWAGDGNNDTLQPKTDPKGSPLQ